MVTYVYAIQESFMYNQYIVYENIYIFQKPNLFATQGEYTTYLSKVSSIGKIFSFHHHVPHSNTNIL